MRKKPVKKVNATALGPPPVSLTLTRDDVIIGVKNHLHEKEICDRP
jgi:hypothetical protein